MILNSPYITGSLTVTGNIIASGSVTLSGSIASASFATTASNALTLDGLNSASFAPSTTFNTVSSSYATVSASYALASGSLSTRVTKIEGNYATTGSNAFNGSQNITGSLTVSSQIVAQTLNVQQVTSSIVYSSGSNTFGNLLTDVQQFTGSLRVTGSGNNYFLGGNVGLGITTPSTLLDIQANASANSLFTLTNTNTSGYSGILFRNSSSANKGFLGWGNASSTNWQNSLALISIGSDPLVFGTSDTEKMRISAGGNLQVTGSAFFSSSITAASSIQLRASYGGSVTFYDTLSSSDTGGISTDAYWTANNQLHTAIFATANKLIKFYANNSSTPTMAVSASSVGIGTITPAAILHTQQTSAGSAVVGALLQNVGGSANTTVSLNFAPHENATSPVTLARISAIRTANSNAPTDIAFATYNDSISPSGLNERMRINALGNVGIGTPSPLGSSVERTLHLSDSGSGYTTLYVTNGANTLKGIIAVDNAQARISFGTQTNTDLRIITNDTTKMFVSSSGLIGINTTTPAVNLHIANNTNTAIRVQASASNGSAEIDLMSHGTQHAYVDYGPNQLRFRSTNSDASVITSGSVLVLQNDGKVGIGTTSPGTQFVVEGPSTGAGLQDGQVYIRTTTAANPTAIGFINSGNTASFNDLAWIRAVINSGNAKGALSFVTRNSDGDNSGVAERMRISSQGYVTTAYQPSFKAGRNSNYNPGANTDIIFNSVSFNVGSHYNSSTGLFTAPISGVYLFSSSVIWVSLTDGQEMDDAFTIRVNGSIVSYDFRRAEYVAGTTGNGGYYSTNSNILVSLATNDIVSVTNYRNLTVHGNANFTWFFGYLLG